MIQDQEEPELSLAFYLCNNSLYSTFYRTHLSNTEGEFLENIFLQRFPIILAPIPGDSEIHQNFPRVILYEEMGEHLIISSVLNMIGIIESGEFHVIAFENGIIYEEIPQCRDQILRGLEICMGDSTAAELMLYVLLSKIHERSALIGALSFNFTNIRNESDSKIIYNSLKRLLRTVILPISLEFLNTQNLTPTKNFDNDRLEHLVLQIPNGTLLILDETILNSGNLTQKGVENLNILMQLIQSQQLTYDFGYTKLNFPTDIKIIALSQGKSLLKMQNSLKLLGNIQEFEFTSDDKLYVEACSQLTVSLPTEVTEIAQAYFVSKRKEKAISIEHLHLLLVLTRYITQSYGEKIAEKKHWDQAISLFTKIFDKNRD